MKLLVNGKQHDVSVPGEMPLLWVLRDVLGLTGTKYGCGIAQCGACTVHVDGQPVRSCVRPVSTVAGKRITTIEGLSPHGDHPVQVAWADVDVVQCGYCQSGQIMCAAALLRSRPNPTDADIDAALSGNVCRCGTYQRVREAIHQAAKLPAAKPRTEGGSGAPLRGTSGGRGETPRSPVSPEQGIAAKLPAAKPRTEGGRS